VNRFSIVAAETADYSVLRLCRLVGVSTSGYYAWQRRSPSTRARSEERIVAKINAIHKRTYRAYGSPRMTAELRDNGETIGRHRVARLMRKHGLWARKRKRFTATTDSKHNHGFAGNVLERQFSVSKPNQVWVSDVTYLRTMSGFCYLSAIIDLHSRAIIGWSVNDTLATDGAARALTYAIGARSPKPGLIHHSDRGCQYASTDYKTILDDNGITASMSRKGNCWDNAVAESFFASLKKEATKNQVFLSTHHARLAVTAYIDGFYNPQRRHSANNGLSPFDFEASYAKATRLRNAA